MKNTFGNSVSVTLFGESHGDAIGAVIDGLTPGIKVSEEYIKQKMRMRMARSDISTPRCEADEPIFLSGVKDGYTEGTPVAIMIKNTNTKSSAYENISDTPRPSHADFTAEMKYHGYQDKRGGGHFSGRITAPLVAAGALIASALNEKGIYIGTHIKSLRSILDRDFEVLESDIKHLSSADFPALDEKAGEAMKNEILKAKADGDSVGGVLETAVIGLPAGVGEPWFDTVEGVLAHILFSIPAVKGVEFGDGFKIAEKLGSEANDAFGISDGKVVTLGNSSGGVQGGITNGMPLTVRTAIKPTPSISKWQKTVNLSSMEECEIAISGRHDPAVIHRARAVVDAAVAIGLADLLAMRFGTDYLSSKT